MPSSMPHGHKLHSIDHCTRNLQVPYIASKKKMRYSLLVKWHGMMHRIDTEANVRLPLSFFIFIIIFFVSCLIFSPPTTPLSIFSPSFFFYFARKKEKRRIYSSSGDANSHCGQCINFSPLSRKKKQREKRMTTRKKNCSFSLAESNIMRPIDANDFCGCERRERGEFFFFFWKKKWEEICKHLTLSSSFFKKRV